MSERFFRGESTMKRKNKRTSSPSLLGLAPLGNLFQSRTRGLPCLVSRFPPFDGAIIPRLDQLFGIMVREQSTSRTCNGSRLCDKDLLYFGDTSLVFTESPGGEGCVAYRPWRGNCMPHALKITGTPLCTSRINRAVEKIEHRPVSVDLHTCRDHTG